MKKIYLLLIGVICLGNLVAQEWNFSDAQFSALGDLTATTTVADFTIHASADKNITIGTNGKTIDGYTFTHRLKFNGTNAWSDATPTGRVVSFPVTGNAIITIYGMSSSSSAVRELVVTVGDKTTELGRFSTGGSAIDKASFTYTGGASTIYLFSASSGFNIYLVKVETATSVGEIGFTKEELKSEYFGINGVSYGEVYQRLREGIYIKRTTYSDGSVKATKVLKSDY